MDWFRQWEREDDAFKSTTYNVPLRLDVSAALLLSNIYVCKHRSYRGEVAPAHSLTLPLSVITFCMIKNRCSVSDALSEDQYFPTVHTVQVCCCMSSHNQRTTSKATAHAIVQQMQSRLCNSHLRPGQGTDGGSEKSCRSGDRLKWTSSRWSQGPDSSSSRFETVAVATVAVRVIAVGGRATVASVLDWDALLGVQ